MKSDLEIEFFLHFGYFPNYKARYELDFCNIDRNKYENVPKEELVQLGADLFRKNTAESFQSNKTNTVPLSGGLDSRAILAALLECTSAENIKTYTFGTPGTYDYDIGYMVAHKLGTNHTAIPLDSFDWTEIEFMKAAENFDFQTFLCHHAPPSTLEAFKGGTIWSGYIGDVVTGGHLPKSPSKTVEEAKNRYIKKRQVSKSIKLTYSNGLSQRFSDHLGVIGTNISYDEQIKFAEVGKIIAPHVLMNGFNFQTPFINNDFFNFFINIPDKWRLNQSLFKDMLLTEWPDLFRLPVKNNHGLPLNTSRTALTVRRIKSRAVRHMSRYLRWKLPPTLPMENYFNLDELLLKNSILKSVFNKKLQELKARKIVDWIDIDAIWERQINQQACHADAIKILFSLEMNLQGLEKHNQTGAKQQKECSL